MDSVTITLVSRWLAAVALVFVLPAGLRSQQGTTAKNPFTSSGDRDAGAAVYKSQCAACHGLEGKGGTDAPDLTTGRFRHGSTDEAIFQTIAKGVPGTTMRAFDLTGREIWQVIAHMRLLAIARSAESAKGNPKRGERVFQERECRTCHTVAGDGGITGPDLSGIAPRRTLAEIERSILRPNEEVSFEFWSARAKTKAGKTLSGRRLNEDTYSVQLLGADGKLISVLKDDLAGYEIVRTSAMPSFEGKLQRGDLDDLIAYLANLRAK